MENITMLKLDKETKPLFFQEAKEKYFVYITVTSQCSTLKLGANAGHQFNH